MVHRQSSLVLNRDSEEMPRPRFPDQSTPQQRQLLALRSRLRLRETTAQFLVGLENGSLSELSSASLAASSPSSQEPLLYPNTLAVIENAVQTRAQLLSMSISISQ
jgi:hypothetical protein